MQRTAAGLGLGLFIVRNLVRRQGGRVVARSGGSGEGSRFVVTLRSAPHRVLMPRILVVEDEAHLAEGLQFNLEAEGHEVVEIASDGRAAALGDARGPVAGLRPRHPRPDAARDEWLRGGSPRASAAATSSRS